jgi:uncharacterized protein (TIGR02246 family)
MHRTRSLILALIAVLAAAGCGAPSVDLAAENDAIRARSEVLSAAEASEDLDAVLPLFATDAVIQPANSPQREGRSAIAEVYRQSFAQLKEASRESTRITMAASGDLAFEYGVNRKVFPGPEGDLVRMGKYLAVWKKVEGQWLVAAVSFTSDSQELVPVDE